MFSQRAVAITGRMIGMALGAFLGVALDADTSNAQSAEAIQSYLRQRIKECTLFKYKENFRGRMPGADKPIAIATYTVEGCYGGNNWGDRVAVFYDANGKVGEFKPPTPPIGAPEIDRVTVAGDGFIVRSKDVGPHDAHCCPTVRQTMKYKLENGSIVPWR